MAIHSGVNDEVTIGQERFVLTPNGYVCVSSSSGRRADPARATARIAEAWGWQLPDLIAALQRMGDEQ